MNREQRAEFFLMLASLRVECCAKGVEWIADGIEVEHLSGCSIFHRRIRLRIDGHGVSVLPLDGSSLA